MATQVYIFKITYNGCENKIWRTFEVSSNYDLARLGYMVLASFDTNALFTKQISTITANHRCFRM